MSARHCTSKLTKIEKLDVIQAHIATNISYNIINYPYFMLECMIAFDIYSLTNRD